MDPSAKLDCQQEPAMCDIYAVIEASKLLQKAANEDLPVPVRRMVIHALQRLDDEIDAYFRPANGRDPCSPQRARAAA